MHGALLAVAMMGSVRPSRGAHDTLFDSFTFEPRELVRAIGDRVPKEHGLSNFEQFLWPKVLKIGFRR